MRQKNQKQKVVVVLAFSWHKSAADFSRLLTKKAANIIPILDGIISGKKKKKG